MSGPRIFVDGDSYLAGFLLPAHGMKLKGWEGSTGHIFPFRAGSDFLAAVIRDLAGNATVLHLRGDGFVHERRMLRLLRLKQDDHAIPDLDQCAGPGDTLPRLLLDGDGQAMGIPWHASSAAPVSSKPSSSKPGSRDILVHWLGESEVLRGARPVELKAAPANCRLHIQIGRLLTNRSCSRPIGGPEHDGVIFHSPGVLAEPVAARVLITSLREICPHFRVRRTLSYESIVVDLLRSWRGYERKPVPKRELVSLLGGVDATRYPLPPITFVVVRINSAAVLLYCCRTPKSELQVASESALLFYHKDRPAPFDSHRMGGMEGFNGFIGMHVAAAAHTVDPRKPLASDEGAECPRWLSAALGKALLWQVAHYERGFLNFFFARNNGSWMAITDDSWRARPGHKADLDLWLQKKNARDSDVQDVTIDIPTAVSHRTHWFIARDIVGKDGNDPSITDRLRRKAIEWLTKPGSDPAKDIPVVKIDKLHLVDRREVEDFLALREAFVNYGEARERLRPLNIAVFGPPGAGKGYGVKAVVTHITSTAKVFSDRTLTFNVSQFSGPENLVSAFHQVRNEALRGRVPVIFFDEFDTDLDHKPFGWLKYFLAPMQDGEFNDGGTTYKLGDCVLVFAGGINRSFEEFNGRLRNPSFVEGKGPDFISRLRAHINIRGINKPEDEVDQGRYILRRAVMLHYHLWKRLAHQPSGRPPANGLAHVNVATAFCRIDHFKHGSRSLEAILDMCDLERGRQLGPSDLPSRSQLDMHVDAAEFLKYIYPRDAADTPKSPAPRGK